MSINPAMIGRAATISCSLRHVTPMPLETAFALLASLKAGFSTDTPSIVDPLVPGRQFVSLRKFTQADVTAFCQLTADPNPIHEQRAATSSFEDFKGPIVPGMQVASMFPSIIATSFPGAIYLSQTLKFKAPVKAGQVVRATITLEKLSGRRAAFDTVCHVTDSARRGKTEKSAHESYILAIEGKALALIPTQAD